MELSDEGARASVAEAPVRVLVVDDRPEQITAVKAIIDEFGVEIDEATSGREALRRLLLHDYALVLLDVNMPRMDGFETATLIRQRPRSESTPIIFVTAATPTDTQLSRAYRHGAVDYIYTPVVPEILRAKVAVFIELHRKSDQVRRQAEWVAAEADRRAAQLESRLRNLLDDLTMGVFRAVPATGAPGTDRRGGAVGRLVEANPALLGLLGVADLEGAQRLDLSPLCVLDEEVQSLGRAGAALRDQEVLLPRADGSSFWGLLHRRVAYTPQGAVFIDGLLEDVTERKQAAEALARKAEELARTNGELEHFSYMASHDLQEPLRAVSLYASLIDRRHGEQLDAQARSWLGFVRTSSTRMQQLVRELLSYSRTRTREALVDDVECDELLDRAMFNLELSIREAGAEITRDALPRLRVDPVLMVHLFQNLLGNAIKFRRGPRPKVHVSACLRDGTWEMAVADNGIGIDDSHKEHVFGIFRRLHTRERYEGTGMGLAICRHIVERHGGRIWCESGAEGGTIFRFTLPALAVAAEPAMPSDDQRSRV